MYFFFYRTQRFLIAIRFPDKKKEDLRFARALGPATGCRLAPTSTEPPATKTQHNENAISTRGRKKASCGAAKRVLLLLLFTCEGNVAEVFFDVVRRHALVRERDGGQRAA